MLRDKLVELEVVESISAACSSEVRIWTRLKFFMPMSLSHRHLLVTLSLVGLQ